MRIFAFESNGNCSWPYRIIFNNSSFERFIIPGSNNIATISQLDDPLTTQVHFLSYGLCGFVIIIFCYLQAIWDKHCHMWCGWLVERQEVALHMKQFNVLSSIIEVSF